MSVLNKNMNLTQIDGNDRCADCGLEGPTYAVSNLGILVCEPCAGVHRTLGCHISQVKSLKMGKLDTEQLQAMSKLGNKLVNEKYEQNVPPSYRRPLPKDPQVLREQWIRAKYERQEFTGSAQLQYLRGQKEGYLWKRGKDDKHFQKRRFVLDATENTLKYFNKEEARDPKATLRLDGLNVTVVPDKVGNPNAMQLIFEQDSLTRNLFVYADSGQDLVEWYTAIRSAKLNRLAIAYPGTTMEELCQMITRDFQKEGWLGKTGPRPGDAFRRRWVTLDKKTLMYYEDPMDAFPRGEVYIGNKGFEVVKGFGPGYKDSGFGFVLKTPERSFQFSADGEDDQRDWMAALNDVIRGSCVV